MRSASSAWRVSGTTRSRGISSVTPRSASIRMISSTKSGLPSERSTTNARRSSASVSGARPSTILDASSGGSASSAIVSAGSSIASRAVPRTSSGPRDLPVAPRSSSNSGSAQCRSSTSTTSGPAAASSSSSSTHAPRRRWTTASGWRPGGAGCPSAIPRMGHRSARFGWPRTTSPSGEYALACPKERQRPARWTRAGDCAPSQRRNSRTSVLLPIPGSPRIETRIGVRLKHAPVGLPKSLQLRLATNESPDRGRNSGPEDASRSSRRQVTPPSFPLASMIVAGPNSKALRAADTVRSPTRTSPDSPPARGVRPR